MDAHNDVNFHFGLTFLENSFILATEENPGFFMKWQLIDAEPRITHKLF
jgi:hypothetical protein